ncbi:unnamed protein product [Malus baccata var. baccata]
MFISDDMIFKHSQKTNSTIVMPFRSSLASSSVGTPKGVILKCIFSSLPSMRPFGSSLTSSSVGTPKLSENKARALPGWMTHWEVAREFPKTKP